MNNSRAYVLITPVKDEMAFIGETIASVVNQTLLPLQWVIVSDGSTDRTEEIVQNAAGHHPWIRLFCLPPRQERSFAAVVHATETGINALTVNNYQYIGLLDSDVRFKTDYFEKIVQKFEKNPGLGLGGGMVIDTGKSVNSTPRNKQDIPGAAQFFHRKCFEQLGGLFAIPEGGWDTLTCVCARKMGYETQLFTDLYLEHLKPRNISEGGLLRRTWQMGIRDYVVGYHPLFEIVKCLSRLLDPPLIFGSIAWLTGYFTAQMLNFNRQIPNDILYFIQSEQIERLKMTMR